MDEEDGDEGRVGVGHLGGEGDGEGCNSDFWVFLNSRHVQNQESVSTERLIEFKFEAATVHLVLLDPVPIRSPPVVDLLRKSPKRLRPHCFFVTANCSETSTEEEKRMVR